MEIIGFIGESGTGKSYRAMDVAKQHGLKYVIDDGLLISKNRIIEGHSAKKAPTKVASVKNALFSDDTRAAQMKKAIADENPDGILVLGTSERMVEKITARLDIPAPSKFIYIEDVASEEDIDTAKRSRLDEGKHVIPVPTFEIKKDFSGYFIDTLRMLGSKQSYKKKNVDEKSIVRPTFTYLGDFLIADKVLIDLIKYSAQEAKGVTKILFCNIKKFESGAEIYIEAVFKYGVNINDCANGLIEYVKDAIEKYTGINVLHILINVKSLDYSNIKE